MRIYFCDKCNESIPLKDMQSNRVTIDENKIFCTRCAPRPSRIGQVVRMGYTVLLPSLLLLGGGMAVMAFFGDKILNKKPVEDIEQRITRVETALSGRLDQIEARAKSIEVELAETTAPGDRPSKLARIHQSLRENADAIQQMRHGFNGLKDEVQAKVDQNKAAEDAILAQIQEEAAKRAALLERAMGEIEKSKSEIESSKRRIDDVANMAQSAAVVASAPKASDAASNGGGGGSPKANAAPGPAAPAASPVDEKKLAEIQKKLADKDPSKRFAAVFELFDLKGRKAEEALLGVFGDATDFVQTAAMGCLGDMNAQWTIPNIIPKLKDENTFIRQAAIEALEKLTGQKLDVTPESGSSKLAAKARDLEKWWAENKAKITGAK